ncbi:Dual specificity phosphatase DUPD1 [Araneus ventricosus]|uniref:Dual specificity phosphatase DUPD1 n=1 Tax=Araneus ventricosus TaxID=182803 RepID=A0A4Y2JWZ8_ARAVE|nr:Dual specificity phosphatase DUPD1 [Araneus ventricosus]
MYGDTKSTKTEKISETKRKAKDDSCTMNENIHKSEFLIKDVSIQSTTGEVSSCEVSPSAAVLQKLFAKKILPYYLTVEKKDRKRVLKMIYDITPPPPLRSSKTQASESDFTSQVILSEGMKLKSVSILDMKGEPRQSTVSEETLVKKSTTLKSISGKLARKGVVTHKNISIQVDVDDSFEHARDGEKIFKGGKGRTTIDTEDDMSETKTTEHEQLGTEDGDVESVKYMLQTKVLKDLRRFLLEKDVWDVVFWKRRVSKTEEEIFRGIPISVSGKGGEYLEEDIYPTSHWVDSFMAELIKISSEDVQDILTHFSEEIKLRDVAMNLYWQTMAPKSHQNRFPDWDGNFTNLELEGVTSKNVPIVESSDINKKMSSHENMGIVRHQVENIKKLIKRMDAINDEGNVARKPLSKRLLDAIQVFHGKLCEKVSKILKHTNIKYLTVNNWNKAEELLDHEGTIYQYSELDEIIPRLWIGDFSVFKTPRNLRNIQYRIILGDCKRCITDQHDTCTAKWRPFIYTKPFYTANGNIHCMGIQAVDEATFPVFEYFRSACDFIAKSLSASAKANVAVISKSGKSRCAAILIAYLMIKKNYTLIEAVQELKRKRAIRPNLGFMIQLIQLELKLRRNRKKPDVRTKNVFEIRRKNLLDSYWMGEEQSVAKPTKSFVFLDDRMSYPDRRLGVNTNLFLHSPFSAPGPHFCTDIENSTLRTSLFEMLPFYELDIATTSCEYKIPNVEGRVLASFSY